MSTVVILLPSLIYACTLGFWIWQCRDRHELIMWRKISLWIVGALYTSYSKRRKRQSSQKSSKMVKTITLAQVIHECTEFWMIHSCHPFAICNGPFQNHIKWQQYSTCVYFLSIAPVAHFLRWMLMNIGVYYKWVFLRSSLDTAVY